MPALSPVAVCVLAAAALLQIGAYAKPACTQETFNGCIAPLTSVLRVQTRPDILCNAAKEYMECLFKLPCDLTPEVMNSFTSELTSMLAKRAPNCKLPSGLTATETTTTATAITTAPSTSTPSSGSCTDSIAKCSETYFAKFHQAQDTSGLCGLFEEFTDCIQELDCGISREQKKGIFNQALEGPRIYGLQCPVPTEAAAKTTLSLAVLDLPELDVTEKVGGTTDAGEIADCSTGMKTCADAMEAKIQSNLGNAGTLCSLMNEYISCVLNVACPAEVKQTVIDSTKESLEEQFPGCVLDLPELDVTEKVGGTSDGGEMTAAPTEAAAKTTLSLAVCEKQVGACTDAFDASVQGGILNEDVICRLMNEYAMCVLNIACPVERKQSLIGKAKNTLEHASPGCVLDLPELDVTEKVGETSDAGEMTAETTEAASKITADVATTGLPEQVPVIETDGTQTEMCIDAKKKCKNDLQELIVADASNPEAVCNHLDSYIGCVLKSPCVFSDSEKEEFLEKVRAVVNKSDLGCDLSPPTEQPTTGTPAVKTTPKDCTVEKFYCGREFRSSLRNRNNSPDVLCSNVNRFISCVKNMQCDLPVEEEEQFLRQTRAFVEKNKLSCVLDIDVSPTTETPDQTTVAAGTDSSAEKCIMAVQDCAQVVIDKLAANGLKSDIDCKVFTDFVKCIRDVPCQAPEEYKKSVDRQIQNMITGMGLSCKFPSLEAEEATTVDSASSTPGDPLTSLVSGLTSPSAQDPKSSPPATREETPDITTWEITTWETTPPEPIICASDEMGWPLSTTPETFTDTSTSAVPDISSDTPPTSAVPDFSSDTPPTSAALDISTSRTSVPPIDFAKECADYLDACSLRLKDVISQIVSSEAFCGHLNDYMDCIVHSTCPLSEAQRENVDGFTRGLLFAVPDCDLKKLPPATKDSPLVTESSVSDRTPAKTDVLSGGSTQGPAGTDVVSGGSTEGPAGTDVVSGGSTEGPAGTDVVSGGSTEGASGTDVVSGGSTEGASGTDIVSSGSTEGASGTDVVSGGSTEGPAGTDVVSGASTEGPAGTDVVSGGSTEGPAGTDAATESASVTTETIEVTDIQVKGLTIEYLKTPQVLLSWEISTDTRPASLSGFEVLYKIVSEPKYTTMDVQISDQDATEYETVLNLKPKSKYSIKVRPYGEQGKGIASRPIFIYVSGKAIGVIPELSLSATPLATDAVLVKYFDVLGSALEEPRFFYKRAESPQWTPVQKHFIVQRGDQSIVLSGLRKDTSYVIKARAKFGKVEKSAVTSVVTLAKASPGDMLTLNQDPSGAYVDWAHWGLQDVEGYKATLTFIGQQGPSRRTEVQYLPKQQTRLELDTATGTVDLVKIEPYSAQGLKKGAELSCVQCSLMP